MKQTSKAVTVSGEWKRICDMKDSEIMRLLERLDKQPYGDVQPTYFQLRAELKHRSLSLFQKHNLERSRPTAQGNCPECFGTLTQGKHQESYKCLNCGHEFIVGEELARPLIAELDLVD